MKRKLTIYIFLIAARALLSSSPRRLECGLSTSERSRMPAKPSQSCCPSRTRRGGTTDVSGLLQQFSQAAPDKRLTLIAPDGNPALGDTERDVHLRRSL